MHLLNNSMKIRLKIHLSKIIFQSSSIFHFLLVTCVLTSFSTYGDWSDSPHNKWYRILTSRQCQRTGSLSVCTGVLSVCAMCAQWYQDALALWMAPMLACPFWAPAAGQQHFSACRVDKGHWMSERLPADMHYIALHLFLYFFLDLWCLGPTERVPSHGQGLGAARYLPGEHWSSVRTSHHALHWAWTDSQVSCTSWHVFHCTGSGWVQSVVLSEGSGSLARMVRWRGWSEWDGWRQPRAYRWHAAFQSTGGSAAVCPPRRRRCSVAWHSESLSVTTVRQRRVVVPAAMWVPTLHLCPPATACTHDSPAACSLPSGSCLQADCPHQGWWENEVNLIRPSSQQQANCDVWLRRHYSGTKQIK